MQASVYKLTKLSVNNNNEILDPKQPDSYQPDSYQAYFFEYSLDGKDSYMLYVGNLTIKELRGLLTSNEQNTVHNNTDNPSPTHSGTYSGKKVSNHNDIQIGDYFVGDKKDPVSDIYAYKITEIDRTNQSLQISETTTSPR